MKILSIDPGTKVLGWAAWWVPEPPEGNAPDGPLQGAELVACGLARTIAHGTDWAAMELATQIGIPGPPDLVVLEEMIHYPSEGRTDTRQTQDAKALDLLRVQAIGCYVAGTFRCSFRMIPARRWNGQTPRDVMARRIDARLAPAERALRDQVRPASLRHNTVSAIGLGLFYTGRLTT